MTSMAVMISSTCCYCVHLGVHCLDCPEILRDDNSCSSLVCSDSRCGCCWRSDDCASWLEMQWLFDGRPSLDPRNFLTSPIAYNGQTIEGSFSHFSS